MIEKAREMILWPFLVAVLVALLMISLIERVTGTILSLFSGPVLVERLRN